VWSKEVKEERSIGGKDAMLQVWRGGI